MPRLKSDKSPTRDNPTISILARGARITGTLETDGVLRIEGTVEGDLRVRGQVLLLPGGSVHGNVAAGEAIVAGSIHGDIEAAERVEVHPGGSVEGDVSTPRLVIQDGGQLNGQLRMQDARHQQLDASTRRDPSGRSEPALKRVG